MHCFPDYSHEYNNRQQAHLLIRQLHPVCCAFITRALYPFAYQRQCMFNQISVQFCFVVEPIVRDSALLP